ncbi:MAG: amidohydrolase family protein [Rubrivivax sp.]|nr:amidohydrolase family protein [Rubrivivax sp.]
MASTEHRVLTMTRLPDSFAAGEAIIRTPLWVGADGAETGDRAILVRTESGRRIVAAIAEHAVVAALAPQAPRLRADAICPAFVNAHTHLDLSTYPALRADFPTFLDEMVRHRRLHPQARGTPAAALGLRHLIDQRVAAVGDIVARESVLVSELQQSPLPGVAYWEVVCTNQAAAASAIEVLSRRLPAWRTLQRPGGPVLGLAPQSPYLVCRDVLQFLARTARAEGLPLQIHVAESPAEIEFFRTGGGALARALRSAGFVVPPDPAQLGFTPAPNLSPVRYLAEIGFLDASPTLVHCANVSDEDIRIIAEHGCPVVTCPRSNANLGCGVFPWQRFADAGVSIALATDSVASAHSLDLGAELAAAFAAFGADFGLGTALEWLTAGASRALGRAAQTVAPGSPVDALTLLNLRRDLA